MAEPGSERRAAQSDILARLRRVEGQIRGIQKMIDQERDCEAVVTQLMAARAALDSVSLLIVNRHLERCLLDPELRTDPSRLRRIVEFFWRFAGSESGQATDA